MRRETKDPGHCPTLMRSDWFERPFGNVDLDQFALDLRATAPPAVRDWLGAPLTTRGSPTVAPTPP